MLAAGQLVSLYGLETSPSTLLVARLFGGALLAWGAIVWFARDFRDEAAVPAVLMATGVAEVISLGVAAMATLAGTMNAMGWVAVLIYLFGAGMRVLPVGPDLVVSALKKATLLNYLQAKTRHRRRLPARSALRCWFRSQCIDEDFLIGQSVIRRC